MATLFIPTYECLRFKISGVVAVGDGQFPDWAPYDGQLLTYTGYLETLGGGAGTFTRIQLRNVTKTPDQDLFAVRPAFQVDIGTGELEGGEFIASPTVRAGDEVRLDVDNVSTNPADMTVTVRCRFFREVTV